MMSYKNFLGYDRGEDGQPVINEEEALIVRDIYRWFLEGESCYVIAERLNQNKVPMPSKKIDKETGEYVYKWQCSTVLSILTNEKYKGEAVLQKTVTVDFLTHKHKKNEGEAPQYHVIDSHEAIVEPIEWELVQDELKRREEAKYGKHSATSVFSSKIVCGECGSFYGQKVWHSNDKYRSLIYRCNNKFNKKKFCSTPTLKEEGIKAAFIKSFNTLQNENKVEDLLLMIEEVKDTSKIDSDMVDAQTELDVTLELANKMIKENASTAQDQEEYQKKYQRLEKRSDELKPHPGS